MARKKLKRLFDITAVYTFTVLFEIFIIILQLSNILKINIYIIINYIM